MDGPATIRFEDIQMMEGNVDQRDKELFIKLSQKIIEDLLHTGYWSDPREIITWLWFTMEKEHKGRL